MFAVNELRDMVQRELDRAEYVEYPEQLFEPVRYLVGDSGKRLRPILVLMAYNLFHDDVERAMRSAIGVEIFHNYTLLHDDVMDNATLRRGKPTVHCKWNRNVAILSGDAAAIVAYKYIESCEDRYLRRVISNFNSMAMDICKGQQLDMEFETRNDVTEREYLDMIYWKTSVLIAGSLRHGAIIAGASDEISNALYDFGGNLGLAFQLQDDFLDVYGDVESFGKSIGGDIITNKKTYLLIKALELANEEQRGRLLGWLERSEFDHEEKIAAVRGIYDEVNIRPIVEATIEGYLESCRETLRHLAIAEEKKGPLFEIVERISVRNN